MGNYGFYIIIALAFGAMWLMSSRTRKQQQAAQQFRNTLEPGDEVMTGSGLFGTVAGVLDFAQGLLDGSASAFGVEAIRARVHANRTHGWEARVAGWPAAVDAVLGDSPLFGDSLLSSLPACCPAGQRPS